MIVLTLEGDELIDTDRLIVSEFTTSIEDLPIFGDFSDGQSVYAVSARYGKEYIAVSRFYVTTDEAAAAIRRFSLSMRPDFFINEAKLSLLMARVKDQPDAYELADIIRAVIKENPGMSADEVRDEVKAVLND